MHSLKLSIILVFSICIIGCGSDKNNSSKSSLQETKREGSDPRKTEYSTKINVGSGTIPKEQLEKAVEIIKATNDKDLAGINAQSKFKSFCATCHGFKGNANINGAKDLTKSTISLTESVAQIYHGKGLMTPFKGILKDAEIVALAKYCETLR